MEDFEDFAGLVGVDGSEYSDIDGGSAYSDDFIEEDHVPDKLVQKLVALVHVHEDVARPALIASGGDLNKALQAIYHDAARLQELAAQALGEPPAKRRRVGPKAPDAAGGGAWLPTGTKFPV